MRCLSSTTVACSTTSSTCLWKTNTPELDASGPSEEFATPVSVDDDGGVLLVGVDCEPTAADDWLGVTVRARDACSKSAPVRSRKISRTLFRRSKITSLRGNPVW